MSEDAVSPALRLPRPEALELIDATEVGSLLVETERELRALEAEAERLVVAAQDAEVVAADAQTDPATTTWMLVRLQRFVDDLRAEAARDAETIVEVARHHVQARSDGPARRPWLPTAPEPAPVRSEIPSRPAALIVPDLVEVPAPAPVVEVPAPAPVVEVPAPAPVVEVPAPAQEVLPPPAPPLFDTPAVAEVDPDALPSAPVFVWSPPPPPAAAEPGPTPDSATTVAPVAPVPEPGPTPGPAVVSEVAAAPVAPVVPEVPVVEPTPVPSAGLTASPTPKRKRRFLPLSVVLEVLAVILILVFIVLRLS